MPGIHVYENGPTPPVDETVADPSVAQVMEVLVTEMHGWLIFTTCITLSVPPPQLKKYFSLTVNVPSDVKACDGLLKVDVLAPPDTGSQKSHNNPVNEYPVTEQPVTV